MARFLPGLEASSRERRAPGVSGLLSAWVGAEGEEGTCVFSPSRSLGTSRTPSAVLLQGPSISTLKT